MIAGLRVLPLSLAPSIDATDDMRVRWQRVRTYEDDVEWARVPNGWRSPIRNSISIARIVLTRSDAVVTHSTVPFVFLGAVMRFLRPRTALLVNFDGRYSATKDLEFDDPIPGRASGWRERFRRATLSRTDRYVPWSEFSARRAIEVEPDIRDRLAVIHPGIDLETWEASDERPDRERLRILFVGGDGARKGLDTLLAALESLGLDSFDTHLVTDPNLFDEYVRTTIDTSSSITVHHGLAPGSSTLRDLYRSADLFVLPTKMDLSSLATLEAMASGVPVITTTVGGIEDITIHRETGMAVNPNDVGGLARTIEELRANTGLRRELVRAAHRHVRSHFDARRNGDQLLDTIREAVHERRIKTPASGRQSTRPDR